MQVLQTLAHAAGHRDQEIEQARSTALTCAAWIGFAGFIGVLSCWAAFFIGYILAASAITTSIVIYNHCASYESVFNNNCCVNARGGFSTMSTMCMINAIMSGVGCLICVLAIAFYAMVNEHFDVVIFIVFACVALVGCIICLIASIVAMSPLGDIHRKIEQLLTINVAPTIAGAGRVVAGVAVAVGSAVASANPPQPAYTIQQQVPQPGYPVHPNQQVVYPQQPPMQQGVPLQPMHYPQAQPVLPQQQPPAYVHQPAPGYAVQKH